MEQAKEVKDGLLNLSGSFTDRQETHITVRKHRKLNFAYYGTFNSEKAKTKVSGKVIVIVDSRLISAR